MALNLQGFEKSLNLAEATADGDVLNNLGGGNIQQDIGLFTNNKKNISTLVWQPNTNQSSITNNRFVFPTTVPFVFTNGDRVTVRSPTNVVVAGQDYTIALLGNSTLQQWQALFTTLAAIPIVGRRVRASASGTLVGGGLVYQPEIVSQTIGSLNPLTTYFVVGLQVGLGVRREQSAFGLSTIKGGSLVSLAGITSNVVFRRNDEVFRENLDNITTPPTLETGLTNEGGRFSYEIGATFAAAFDVVDSYIDNSNFLRTLKYTSITSIATDRRVSVEGTIVSSDPASTNTSNANLLRVNSPGIYITDPFSNVDNITKVRAYSTSAQPWSEAGPSDGTGRLVTKSKQVNIGDLFFENGIKIAEFDGLSSNAPASVSTFTHKLPVTIDGVEYFVLVKSV